MFPDHLIIDFDSTFITKESLDELARFSLGEHPEKKGRLEKIRSLTEAGMVGEITFDESLSQRMALLDADRRDVEFVTSQLMNAITPSFAKQIDFLQKHNESVWIISGGFREMIIPIVSLFGISPPEYMQMILSMVRTKDSWGRFRKSNGTSWWESHPSEYNGS